MIKSVILKILSTVQGTWLVLNIKQCYYSLVWIQLSGSQNTATQVDIISSHYQFQMCPLIRRRATHANWITGTALKKHFPKRCAAEGVIIRVLSGLTSTALCLPVSLISLGFFLLHDSLIFACTSSLNVIPSSLYFGMHFSLARK